MSIPHVSSHTKALRLAERLTQRESVGHARSDSASAPTTRAVVLAPHDILPRRFAALERGLPVLLGEALTSSMHSARFAPDATTALSALQSAPDTTLAEFLRLPPVQLTGVVVAWRTLVATVLDRSDDQFGSERSDSMCLRVRIHNAVDRHMLENRIPRNLHDNLVKATTRAARTLAAVARTVLAWDFGSGFDGILLRSKVAYVSAQLPTPIAAERVAEMVAQLSAKRSLEAWSAPEKSLFRCAVHHLRVPCEDGAFVKDVARVRANFLNAAEEGARAARREIDRVAREAALAQAAIDRKNRAAAQAQRTLARDAKSAAQAQRVRASDAKNAARAQRAEASAERKRVAEVAKQARAQQQADVLAAKRAAVDAARVKKAADAEQRQLVKVRAAEAAALAKAARDLARTRAALASSSRASTSRTSSSAPKSSSSSSRTASGERRSGARAGTIKDDVRSQSKTPSPEKSRPAPSREPSVSAKPPTIKKPPAVAVPLDPAAAVEFDPIRSLLTEFPLPIALVGSHLKPCDALRPMLARYAAHPTALAPLLTVVRWHSGLSAKRFAETCQARGAGRINRNSMRALEWGESLPETYTVSEDGHTRTIDEVAIIAEVLNLPIDRVRAAVADSRPPQLPRTITEMLLGDDGVLHIDRYAQPPGPRIWRQLATATGRTLGEIAFILNRKFMPDFDFSTVPGWGATENPVLITREDRARWDRVTTGRAPFLARLLRGRLQVLAMDLGEAAWHLGLTVTRLGDLESDHAIPRPEELATFAATFGGRVEEWREAHEQERALRVRETVVLEAAPTFVLPPIPAVPGTARDFWNWVIAQLHTIREQSLAEWDRALGWSNGISKRRLQDLWPEHNTINILAQLIPRALQLQAIVRIRSPEIFTDERFAPLQSLVTQLPFVTEDSETATLRAQRLARYAAHPHAWMTLIYSARTNRGFSQDGLAARLRADPRGNDLRYDALHAMEWGAVLPTSEEVPLLAEALQLSAAQIRAAIADSPVPHLSRRAAAVLLEPGGTYNLRRLNKWPERAQVFAIIADSQRAADDVVTELNARWAGAEMTHKVAASPAYRGRPFFIDQRDVSKITKALADPTGYLALLIYGRNDALRKSSIEAAPVFGISEELLNKIERGERYPDDALLARFAARYGLDPAQLRAARAAYCAQRRGAAGVKQ